MASFVLTALCLAGSALALTPKDPPYGQLSVKGGNIVGANGQKVQLAGMSLYWSQWMGQYWTRDVVNAIKCQWNANLVRAAMGVQAEYGGYLGNKAAELAKVRTVVEAAIEAGIYVIIDWHDHEGAAHRNDAIAFFEQMARDYGKYPHVIYETFNEPLNVDWVSVVKPYHEAVLKAIRAIDADNLVVLGTPDWSGSPEKAKASPVSGTNILYTVHFYTGADASWQEFQRNRVAEYVKGGFPIFITEYGVSKEDGGKTGGIYTEEANKWYSMLDSNKIAYANWAMDDAPEASAALKPGTSPSAVGQDSSLTDSGKFIKAKLRSMNLGISCSGSSPSPAPAPAPAPAPSPPASGSGKVAVSVKQTASWNGGGQADIVVTNNGDAKVCGATIQLATGKIASFWNLVSSDNKNFTPQYQMNLAKGQSYTAGGVFEGAVPSFKIASTKNC